MRGLHHCRVPAYLITPVHYAPPYPCILLAHGMDGSKEVWLESGSVRADTAQKLLMAGFAVMALDAPYHGERTYESDYESIYTYIRPNIYREMIVQ